MVDNDQNNDEYKFVELDGLDNDMMEGMDQGSAGGATSSIYSSSPKKNIKRNALIAIVLVVFLMLMYKIIAYLFFTSKENTNAVNNVTPPVTQVAIQPVQPVVTPVITAPVQPVNTGNTAELTQKVAAMEIAQQNVRSEVGTVSQQVGTVNNNVNNLNNQIANLNQVISNLSAQMTKQSEEIGLLMARTQPKHIVKPHIQTAVPQFVYYIQAVIPGRAWLIGTNGSTLTVREGTKVTGYGIVKLIDPLQGRVVTSSGKVIRFSQEDS